MVHVCYSTLRQAQSRELSWTQSDIQRINHMHRKLDQRRDSLSRLKTLAGKLPSPFLTSTSPFHLHRHARNASIYRLSIVQG
jgi:hypothetical protein